MSIMSDTSHHSSHDEPRSEDIRASTDILPLPFQDVSSHSSDVNPASDADITTPSDSQEAPSGRPSSEAPSGGNARFFVGQAYDTVPTSPLESIDEPYPYPNKWYIITKGRSHASSLVSGCPGGFFVFKKTQEEAIYCFNEALVHGQVVVVVPVASSQTYTTCVRYRAVPAGPLVSIEETMPRNPWYIVTIGRFVGVFDNVCVENEAHWATVYCSGALMQRKASQKEAVEQFNACLRLLREGAVSAVYSQAWSAFGFSERAAVLGLRVAAFLSTALPTSAVAPLLVRSLDEQTKFHFHIELHAHCNGGLKNAMDSVTFSSVRPQMRKKVWAAPWAWERIVGATRSVSLEVTKARSSVPKDAVIEGCYDEFSHQVLWPALHYAIPDVPKTTMFYESARFKQYVKVNQKFTDTIKRVWREGDHRIHVDFMGVALNEERNLPTVEEVKKRLLDAGNI
ncbi:hypothetical protein EV421DRAFT_1740711 [Armillaria borealis]|uniref:Uncharacterized protein n=1 Tax=Armillaria borealis TaxID=47425 RepID=A0AA39J229_9AGAR|nr:hypothetical protein EV421DRAFT_1740711 [Armillaria borealis]